MARVNDPEEIAHALSTARTVAVVGCSPRPERASHGIARYLRRAGFQVVPVNPSHEAILGERCYPDLGSLPASLTIDVVSVFRRSELVEPIAAQAIERRVGFFFMQDGVYAPEVARRLTEAGIPVAMDRCIYRDHRALSAGGLEALRSSM
jgi:hypothetical protein